MFAFVEQQGPRFLYRCELCGLEVRTDRRVDPSELIGHDCRGERPAVQPATAAGEPRRLSASEREAVTARMLAEIDVGIATGTINPWAVLGRDRTKVESLLARCAGCDQVADAGCDRFAATPCKRWSLWQQTVLVGHCPCWGEWGMV